MLKEMWPDVCPVSTVGEFDYDPGKGPVKHITMPHRTVLSMALTE